MNNGHKPLQKKTKASNTFGTCFVKIMPNFFTNENNSAAINSLPVNHLCFFSLAKMPERRFPHIVQALYRMTVYCCFLHNFS